MRKFVSNIHSIFLLCLFFPFIGNSQTVFWQDDFSNPATWKIDNSGQFRALKETINLEQVATGVYFIKIDDNVNLMYKIVKD
jgi:hypothetical protein